MVKEDILLGLEMGRLEIEPLKLNKTRTQDKPAEHVFIPRNHYKKNFIQNKCCCPLRKQTNLSICKRRSNKILKDPVLRILKCDNKSAVLETENQQLLQNSSTLNSDPLSLCTLVKNCNQLKISTGSSETKLIERNIGNDTQWWRNDISVAKDNKDSRQNNQAGSCSQQALNPPCDVTIDELASYFETLVHIPKKMSSMAEMMYI